MCQLDAIDAFVRRRVEDDEDVEMKAPAEHKREEETLQTEETQPLRADEEEQNKPEQQREVVTTAASDNAVVVAPNVENDAEDDSVEKTQPSSSTGVGIAPPWEAATAAKTPQELLAKNEKASNWLNSNLTEVVGTRTNSLQVVNDDERPVGEVEKEMNQSVDHPSLYEQWPPQLEERRKMWFVPRSSSRRPSGAGMGMKRTVVYWMHSTLRVMQGITDWRRRFCFQED